MKAIIIIITILIGIIVFLPLIISFFTEVDRWVEILPLVAFILIILDVVLLFKVMGGTTEPEWAKYCMGAVCLEIFYLMGIGAQRDA